MSYISRQSFMAGLALTGLTASHLVLVFTASATPLQTAPLDKAGFPETPAIESTDQPHFATGRKTETHSNSPNASEHLNHTHSGDGRHCQDDVTHWTSHDQSSVSPPKVR